MKRKEKMNYIEAVNFGLLCLAFIYGTIYNITIEQFFSAFLLAGLAMLSAYPLIQGFRGGFRRPTAFESFKYWMILRPVCFALINIALIFFFVLYGRAWLGNEVFESTPIMLGLVLYVLAVFAGMVYMIFRAPQRSESDSHYQKRIGWQEPQDNS